MKSRTIISIVLAVVAVALAYFVFDSVYSSVKFNDEYEVRREASADKLKAIRTLEEAYKSTYGHYTGSFDTLFTRLLNEDSLSVVSKVINYDKIPEDVEIDEMTEADKIKAGYMTKVVEFVNPVENLRKTPKAKFNLTDEEILNLRYIPYPEGTDKQFQLQAGYIEKSGYQLPVFECVVMMEDLLSDLPEQLVINKIDELVKNKRFPGWKVGDMTQAITDGNFE